MWLAARSGRLRFQNLARFVLFTKVTHNGNVLRSSVTFSCPFRQFEMGNRRVSSSGVGWRRRRAKRQYFGPRQALPDLPVEDVPVEGVDEVSVSASARKLSSKPDWLEQDSDSASDDDLPSNPDSGSSSEEEDLEAQASVQGNRIADLQCLQSILDAVAVCMQWVQEWEIADHGLCTSWTWHNVAHFLRQSRLPQVVHCPSHGENWSCLWHQQAISACNAEDRQGMECPEWQFGVD